MRIVAVMMVMSADRRAFRYDFCRNSKDGGIVVAVPLYTAFDEPNDNKTEYQDKTQHYNDWDNRKHYVKPAVEW
jgi:hypothetical protein